MRLRLVDKLFLDILYIMWELLSYYERQYCLVHCDWCIDLLTDAPLGVEDGLTYIYLDAPKDVMIRPTPDELERLRSDSQEYLTHVLLPNQNRIMPFDIDEYRGTVTEGLYIEELTCDDNCYHFKILYIDSPKAQHHVIDIERKKMFGGGI